MAPDQRRQGRAPGRTLADRWCARRRERAGGRPRRARTASVAVDARRSAGIGIDVGTTTYSVRSRGPTAGSSLLSSPSRRRTTPSAFPATRVLANPGGTSQSRAREDTCRDRHRARRLSVAGSTKIRGVKRRDRLPSEGRASVRGRRLDVQPSMSATLTPRILVLPALGDGHRPRRA